MTTPQGRKGLPGQAPDDVSHGFPVTTGKAGHYEYTITPRSADLGGGWRLRLLEDGAEVGGGVYPADEYADACTEAVSWLESRPDAPALGPEPTPRPAPATAAAQDFRGLDVVISDMANVVDSETRPMEWIAICTADVMKLIAQDVASFGGRKGRKVAFRIEGMALIVRDLGYRLAELRDTIDGETSAIGCGAGQYGDDEGARS
ncbi:MAG: hypothetical protein RBR52_15050 [Thiomonas sp.]|uniref:hypothetical protein n=1 Tax=Thiomonas sp. TaxID=2047785 RepID=UPI002A3724CB|nr:hypothetical protein [Thiomonas sp.]MDY0331794.1 hypothetical protein [Thiomonas sp.]